MPTKYVSHPGGLILHMEDGSQGTFDYGAPVEVDLLAEYQRSTPYLVDTERSENPVADLERQAHREAAFADLGQVNSTGQTVPANFDDLDEDTAMALVRVLSAYPEQQAAFYVHEKLNQGREKVLASVSDEAKEAGEGLLDSYNDLERARHTRAAEGDYHGEPVDEPGEPESSETASLAQPAPAPPPGAKKNRRGE
jgi:hypothetical protein